MSTTLFDGIVIREFLPTDIPAAVELWKQTPGVGLSEADEPDALLRFLRRNPQLSHVAQSSSGLIATILCGHDGRRGLIHHLVVEEAQRGAGLGTRLLRAALSGLRSENIDKAHLLVFRDNDIGQRFWRRHAVERSEIGLFSVSVPKGGGADDVAQRCADQ